MGQEGEESSGRERCTEPGAPQGSWECVQIFMPDRELPEMRDPERKGKVFGVEREPKGEKAQPGSFLSPKSQLCRVPGRKMRPKGGQGLEPPPGR